MNDDQLTIEHWLEAGTDRRFELEALRDTPDKPLYYRWTWQRGDEHDWNTAPTWGEALEAAVDSLNNADELE